MKYSALLVGSFFVTLSGLAQQIEGVTSETNAVLESSLVLDQTTAVQGNKVLKIERLSTPDEDLIKALEGQRVPDVNTTPVVQNDAPLHRVSYLVAAEVYEHAYALLTFWSLDVSPAVKTQVWTNIISWNELSASPVFSSEETEYTMMILPSAAKVSEESAVLPTNLPSVADGVAYFQGVGDQVLGASDLAFMEALHVHYDLKKELIERTHHKKVQAQQEKKTVEAKEALQQKTVTLRFWRQEDKAAPASE